jgi:hypothetical protein
MRLMAGVSLAGSGSALHSLQGMEVLAAAGSLYGNKMTAEPAGRIPEPDQHEVIHLGGEAAVVVPVGEYRVLRALERLAAPDDLENAKAEAAMQEYREWSAAGRPGAISHAEARQLLLG